MSDERIFKKQDLLTLLLDTGIDISGASEVLIKYKKPSGALGSFTASAYNTTIAKYVVASDTDINESGYWVFWVYITEGGKSAPSKPVRVKVWLEGETE